MKWWRDIWLDISVLEGSGGEPKTPRVSENPLKNHVVVHGETVVPGVVAEAVLSNAHLVAAVQNVGFPLLIKPSAEAAARACTWWSGPRISWAP